MKLHLQNCDLKQVHLNAEERRRVNPNQLALVDLVVGAYWRETRARQISHAVSIVLTDCGGIRMPERAALGGVYDTYDKSSQVLVLQAPRGEASAFFPHIVSAQCLQFIQQYGLRIEVGHDPLLGISVVNRFGTGRDEFNSVRLGQLGYHSARFIVPAIQPENERVDTEVGFQF
jgi:hypothetical protein